MDLSNHPGPTRTEPTNPLRDYFDSVREGPGVWKWLHYFEIYHRHLAKFVGRPLTMVEIGVYSGGSLPMWRHYFGADCRLHGVDVQPACKAYEEEHVTIHIGDQADREFWRHFREHVPTVDVLIDDGGHLPQQQRVTLEEMLPHLQPGGVYICEDIHHVANPFSKFVHDLADSLNAFTPVIDQDDFTSFATSLQSTIHSFHFYPFMVVIEKGAAPLQKFVAPKRGTQWQPFL